MMLYKNYRALVKSHPAIFENLNAPLKIVLSEERIAAWQAQAQKELSLQHLPLSWADIGILLEDPYFLIVRDLVEFPDGGLRGYARSFSTSGLAGGIGVAILPHFQGKLLLLRQYRHPPRKWFYEIPRGFGEPLLSAEENAKKELFEEAGGVVSKLVDLGDVHSNSGFESQAVKLFLADLASIGNPEKNEGIDSFSLMSIHELESKIMQGEVSDGFTIAAYTRAKLRKLL